MDKWAIVRCRIEAGVRLAIWDMKPEFPGNAYKVGHPGRTHDLLHGERNVVPMDFWEAWAEQHPGGLPGVHKIGELSAADESPRAG